MGFEPTVRLPVHRISSAAHSTTLPPLHGANQGAAKGVPGRGSAPLAHGSGLAKLKAAKVRDGITTVRPFEPIAFVGVTLVRAAARSYIWVMDRASFFSFQAGRDISAPPVSSARFSIGDVVRHRMFGFRGVVFDVDPVFANSEEWYESIPEDIRPPRDQPFYHLLAENDESSYVAYVSQQNLQGDADAGPVEHPSLDEMFEGFRNGRYRLRRSLSH